MLTANNTFSSSPQERVPKVQYADTGYKNLQRGKYF